MSVAIKQEEQGEALMLDDSFFELLLNSDLPEKLAEQINKNLLSEAEQKQAEEKERERLREAAAAEAAAQAAARAAQEKDISEKKIEEIVEAITHEPSFEALFAQWGTHAPLTLSQGWADHDPTCVYRCREPRRRRTAS